jgi:hypothetical protein
MPQLFPRKSNALFYLFLCVAFVGLLGAGALAWAYKWSSYPTEIGKPVLQPVAFSHQHHVGGLGLDCRYCHASVELSANAGMPPTKTCMTCHSQIWQNAPMLKPVRDSFKDGTSLKWNRVTRIPHYVYFDHSIHVQKGIGCTSCHGDISRMPLTWKVRTFYMRDCLSCHRNPEKYIRPEDDVFNPDWKAPSNQLELGALFVEKYHIPKQRLTDCMTCHR